MSGGVTVDVVSGDMPDSFGRGGEAGEGYGGTGERRLNAGFPSPAENFASMPIDLNRVLVRHRSATFFGRVRGDGMSDMGIGDGDLLIIDRSAAPADGRVAVCHIDGEFTLRRIKVEGGCLHLDSPKGRRLSLCEDGAEEWRLWGVVTYVVKRL